MKKLFKNLMPMLLLVAGLGISPNAWGDTGIYAAYVSANNGDTKDVTSGDISLGSVDEAKFTGIWVKTFKEGDNSNISKVEVGCKINGKETYHNIPWSKDNVDNSSKNQEWALKDDATIDLATGVAPGQTTTVEYWFKASTSYGDRFYKGKNDQNANLSYSLNAYLVGNGLGLTWNDDNLMSSNTWTKDNVDANTAVAIKIKKKGTWDDAVSAKGTCNVETGSDSNGNLTFNTGDHKSKVTISVSDAKINVNVTPYYTVTFNDGTSDVETKEVLSGSTTTAPSNPSKTGYTFDGWYNGNNKFTNNSTTITSDITYTAKWTAKKTTITLNAKGGTGGTTQVTATYDAAMPTATMPTKIGYAFGGYYDGENGTGTQYYTNTGASACAWHKDISSTTLYAKWTAKTTTITLDAKGGTDGTAQVTATYDAAMPAITKPTKNGYNFDGYYDADGSTSGSWGTQYYSIVGASARTWDKDVATATLYAKWTETMHTAAIAYMCESESIKDATTSGQAGIATTTAITAPEITGYTFSSWATLPSGATTSNQLTDATINVNLTADDLTITANYTRNATYDLVVKAGTHVTTVSGGVTGQTSVPFVQQISATAFDNGYEFNNWTASPAENAEFASSTSATTNVTVKNGSVDVTANAKATTYSITYNNVESSEHSNPTTYTIETATFALADASRDNYTFDGWYDAETDGDKVTSIEQGSTGNITLWARWHETLHSVNIVPDTGIESVSPAGDTKIGNVTPVQIEATVKEGYTWENWTTDNSSNVTITDANANPTTIKATGSTNVYAHATENLSTVTISVNDGNMGSVDHSEVKVGISTSRQVTATPKTGYKFVNWTLSGGATSTSTLTNTTITIKGNGTANSTGTAVATFEEDLSTPWRLNIGVDGQGGWQQPNFVKRTGESTGKIAYVSVELTGGTTYHFNYVTGESTYKGPETDGAEMPANTEWTFDKSQRAKFIAGVSGTYTFKIDYTNNDNPKASYETPSTSGIKGDWTGWAHEDGTVVDNVLTYTHTFDATGEQKFKVVFNGVFFGQENEAGRMTRQNHENWTLTSANGGKDIYLNVDMIGEYIFTYNGTTNKLSVTYPSETMIPVTVYLDGETASTVEVGEATHPTIEAPQYVNGKRFAGWQADEGVTLVNASARSTQITAVTGTGKSVRATYNSNYMVYFKNTPGWGDVHVFFYTVDKHWKDNGTGVKYYDDNEKKWVQIATGHQMTRLNDKSDIWYYDYSGVSDVHGAIAFNDQEQYDYEYFASCQAAYRTDWDRGHNLSVFVPEKNISEKKNNNTTAYYNKGYWMKYDDLQTGYYLRVDDKSGDYEFAAASNGEPYKTTITLEGTQTYTFSINGCNGSYYRNNGEMTSSGSHSGWDFYEGVNNNCRITTSAAGDYTFTLTFGDGMLLVSVEYPLSQNDYRVVYTDNSHPCHPSTFIRKGNGNKDTVSFFINTEKNPALKFQYCSNIEGSTVTWSDVDGGTISLNDITGTGIYNFYLEQTSTSISCTGHELYTGDFYIRTAIAAGGWDAYKGSDDNLLPYIEYGLDESQKFKFTHAYTNWVDKNKNAKYCIANDYSLCISDTLVGDDIIGHEVNADWLKNGANIRFMWNKNTNALSRAYLSGSTNTEDRYLVLTSDAKMFLDDGSVIVEGTEENHRKGLHANELNFTDKNNWVYQADIKAQPGCAVKLTAAYNGEVQYFIGSNSESKTIINSSSTDDKQYTMRVVYDFKTNRLTAGWVPDGQEITDNIKLGGDMLITRTHQEDAQQITFGDNGSISDIHNVYAVLTIKKDVMLGKNESGYKTPATNQSYDRTMYWISFPFDVKISEVFGVDGYAKKWIMQRYNGAKRAEIGWFQETDTFWEYLAPTSTLQAYKGYLLILNAKYFNTEDADVWKNSATEANFYFPSAEKNVGIINKSSVTIDVPAHECLIDRTFGENNEKNHKNTDSHWNVIGIPTFQNSTASGVDPKYNNFKSFYAWNSERNTYNAETTLDGPIRFNTMQAYMVQYAGEITWSNVSVVAPKPVAAPKYTYADEKNYLIDLTFSNGEAEDKTYIHLADEASTDFVLNEDMMKITNAGTPNIYTYAGAYDVAFNETKMDNQTVTLGVSAPKAGTYTFAMPKEFSGTAKLMDLVEGITTDLNISNYSVDLNKGTYNDRFQLLLEVEAKAPTSVEATGDRIQATGKTTKLLRNGNIYLINAGRVYNATGTMVR